MPWYGPSGSCGCCDPGVVCDNCTAVTYFTISGLSNANCTGGCDARNGTYVFRTAGSYFETAATCGWAANFSLNNCGLDDSPAMYIGPYSGSCGSTNAWGISFENVGGLVRVRVTLTLQYILAPSGDTSQPDSIASSYSVEFRDDFTDCAAAVAAGTLPFFSSSVIDCKNGGTGDLCNLLGVSIAIG